MKHQIKITVGNTTLSLSDAVKLYKQLAPLFNGSTAETKTAKKAKTGTPRANCAPSLPLSDRMKFFVGLIWKETGHNLPKALWAVKNPLAFAHEKRLTDECTPRLVEEITAWASRVKDGSVQRSARDWELMFKDKIARRQFRDPNNWGFYNKNNNTNNQHNQQRN